FRRVLFRSDGCDHVRLNLGRGQGPVVDADLVDHAGEVLAPDGVAANLERAVGDLNVPACRHAADLGAVDVQTEGSAVIGAGQVAPSVQRQLRVAQGVVVGRADADGGLRPGRVIIGIEGVVL